MIPVLTLEPLTFKVKVPLSEPYLADVILMAVTLDFAPLTGTAVNEPAALLVPSLRPDFPLYTLLTDEMELIKVLEDTALVSKFDVVRAEVPSEPVENATAYVLPDVGSVDPLLAAVTVTTQVAEAVPHLAVIVAVPAALAVTVPPLTVATEELLVDQVTVPEAVAVKVALLPATNDNVDLFKETESVVVEPEDEP